MIKTAPKEHWIDDSHAPQCYSCKVAFTSVIRRHHCRLCGEVFCDKCSARKVSVEEIGIRNERACDKCFFYQTKYLPYLQNEKHFMRYEKNGDISSVWISVSKDEKSLLIRYEKGPSRFPHEIDLSSVQRIQDGQNTPVWDSHVSGCLCFGGSGSKVEASICFSIFFLQETVDIKADALNAKQAFYEAFEAFLAIRKSRTAQFIDTARQKVKEKEEHQKIKEQDEKRQLIGKKYDNIRANMHKKYNVT